MPLRRTFLFTLLCLSLGPTGAAGQSAQEYEGAAALGIALRRLGATARVLQIAAHPDDENTALFAPLALGRGVDAAYLSLTRGEGGQNGIGPELGIALGVIRSEELLAARRLDGGGQFFSRAIDYGYSKNAEEAFRHWPRDTILADVVAVIRRYRPDVIVSVWSGTERDGHGQHEAAGILAREAALAAGDPARFPEQIAAGLRPHTPTLYYRSAWFSEGPPDVELNTGALDPLLGASYHQIAMASRSRHRSQDQGRRLNPGPRRTAFDRVDPAAPVEVAESRSFGRYGEGAPEIAGSMFAGVDTLLSQRARGMAGAAQPIAPVVTALEEYERLVAEARRAFDPLEPWTLLPTLARAHDRLEDARSRLRRTGEPTTQDLVFHLERELDDLAAARLRAANLQIDAVADEARVVPGQTFTLELSVWNGGTEPVRADVEPIVPAGWRADGSQGEETVVVAPGQRVVVEFAVTVPDDAPPTMPYYLDPLGSGPVDVYDWPGAPGVRGLPFAPQPVRGGFRLRLGAGPPIRLQRDASWIGVDARNGEFREPVKVVPEASVSIEPKLAVVPLASADQPLEIAVRLRNHAPDTLEGELHVTLHRDWDVQPRSARVRLEPGADRVVRLRVSPPGELAAGEYEIGARLVTGRGSHALGFEVVDYPHIRPHHLYERARARVRALDVEVAPVRVGYVEGAGDGVPEALDQLGVDWAPIGPTDLANGDLSRFDVIVTGTRAYEVRDDLPAHNQRLLDWVRRGGTLIVQYNKYPALRRDYSPWPVTIARPHGRVTDETAPVTILEPDHPVFTTPNPIGARDWRGWVQERGLYFWETWDGPLTPLLAMSDPGEEPLTGSLLVAPLGNGTYVYTGLAFFRQLPEGVPGAYRLFANLISLGAR